MVALLIAGEAVISHEVKTFQLVDENGSPGCLYETLEAGKNSDEVRYALV